MKKYLFGSYFMKTLRTLTSLVLTGFLLSSCYSGKTWRTASRQSAGMAPDPSVTKEAIMQVYGADTWGWRGWFAIHTWIAAKRTGESNYKVYDVVGWRGYSGHPVMRITQDIPDLPLIHITEPTRPERTSYAVSCLKKKILWHDATIYILSLFLFY